MTDLTEYEKRMLRGVFGRGHYRKGGSVTHRSSLREVMKIMENETKTTPVKTKPSTHGMVLIRARRSAPNGSDGVCTECGKPIAYGAVVYYCEGPPVGPWAAHYHRECLDG